MAKKRYGWVGSTVITHLQYLNLHINSVLLGLNIEEAVKLSHSHIHGDKLTKSKTGFNSLARACTTAK